MLIVKCFTSKTCQTITQGISEFVKDNNKLKSKSLQIRAHYWAKRPLAFIALYTVTERKVTEKNHDKTDQKIHFYIAVQNESIQQYCTSPHHCSGWLLRARTRTREGRSTTAPELAAAAWPAGSPWIQSPAMHGKHRTRGSARLSTPGSNSVSPGHRPFEIQ